MKNLSGLLLVFGRASNFNSILVIIAVFVSTIGLGQETELLEPINDAYLENATRYNNEFLRIENSTTRIRKGYLMFDLSMISGNVSDITDIKLEMTVYDDEGTQGAIKVHRGDNNIWTELNLSSTNKPNENYLFGSFAPPYANGQKKIVDIEHTILSGNILSIVLEHTGPNGDDMAFASNGPETSHSQSIAPESSRPKLQVTFTVSSATDTDAPNIPTSLTVNSFDHESANISWNASNDNGGGSVAGYYIYNNGTQIASSTSTSTLLTGLLANTEYQLTVRAYDNAPTPNLSNTSSIVNFTTLASSAGGGGTTGGYWTQTGSNLSYIDGNVGIGTTPQSNYKLTIDGHLRAREIKVDVDVWPDYVFKKEYKLPSLNEVQNHIHNKGHLINIPSAKEIEANGLELGEMNKLLLEKIEELTLYILKQQQEIDSLKPLNQRILSIEKKLN